MNYVVTEYSIAALKGLTLKQRAHNLTAIAHPDFQEELKGNSKSTLSAHTKQKSTFYTKTKS